MSEAPPPAVPLDRTLDATLGFEAFDVGPELARARVEVRDHHKQPFGVVHGGVYAALAESLASQATYMGVKDDGMIALGLANQTSFMRPIVSGTIHAEARRRHGGRSTWVWDVEMTDDAGRVCSLSRMTIAVRPAP